MARTTPVRPSTRTRRLTAAVRLGGHEFPFELCARSLTLGPGRAIDYFWMDSTDFRITQSRRRRDHVNVRSCLGHWWAARQSCGRDRDPDEIRHLLLAASYAVLSGGKSAHRCSATPTRRRGRRRRRTPPSRTT